MNDQSEKNTAPLDDSQEWLFSGTETAIVPDGSKMLKRLLRQGAEEDDENAVKDSQSVRIVVRGISEPVRFLEGKAVLGRTDHRQPIRPQVDLTHFGAAERGVSRQHARLELRDEKWLVITDLESSNGTYVHGKRLRPLTPIRIYSGDEIFLGRLAIKILFD